MKTKPRADFSRITSPLLIALLALLASSSVVAQNEEQVSSELKASQADRQVSRIVSRLMQKDHLSRRQLDDIISRRAFEMFTRALDPTKQYFMKSDIEEFKNLDDQIDDGMKDGEYDIAFKIFDRFLQRVDQRTQTATDLVDREFNYEIEEELVTDRDRVMFAGTEEEAQDRWRKRIKYSLMVLKAENMSAEESMKDDPAAAEKAKEKDDPKEKLKNRYKSYARRMHQLDSGDVVEMFITSITTAFDPHTTYMSKETFDNFKISLTLQLEGIGATLQASEDDGYTTIKRIVPGGAADTQGDLKVEDKIFSVGQGDEGEMIDVTGMKLDDVVKQIRGKAGTTVRLGLLSENSESRTISIVREKIKLEDSAARGVVFEEGTKPDGTPFKVGVIDLPSFYADIENAGGPDSAEYKSTTRDVDRILTDFREKNVDSVVLDLRRNGGGSLREAIDCTGLFINTGPVVQVKDAYGRIQKYRDDQVGMSWEGPLVVLTSKFSASASEILAGAVQDYGRGIVVGDTTSHGKGTVQSLVNLNQLVFGTENPPSLFGALKITMQQFYRPNGDSTQKRGVLADVVLPSISDHMDVGESDLDYPVEFDRIPSASFRRMQLANAELLEEIRKSSLGRIGESDEFKKSQEKIDLYLEQKERKAVSLNEQEYLARRKKFDSEKEEKDSIEDQVNHSSMKIERDYYLDEVLQIAVDYTKALKSTSNN